MALNVKGAKKIDLRTVANEIGCKFNDELKYLELRELITKSDIFKKDSDSVQEILTTAILERKEREQIEEQERSRQHELELAKINATNRSNSPSVESLNDDPVVSVEHLLKSVKTLTISIPTRPENWNLFFTSIERAFKTKNVPDNVKAEILINILGEKAANVLTYISEEELTNYEAVKTLVLREYEPSAYACYENFRKAKRQPNETHVQFASRLKSIWEHYLRRRDAKDLETVNQLIITDRILSTLDTETSAHVLIRQGEKWLKPIELGKELDTYFISKGKSLADPTNHQKYPRNESVSQNTPKYLQNPNYNRYEQNQKFKKKIERKLECFICGANHLARDCEKKYQNPKQNKNKKETAVTAKIDSEYLRQAPAVDLQPLETVIVYIGGKEIKCIKDSGTQVLVLNSAILPEITEGFGKMILSSAFGEKVEAKLIRVLLTLKNDSSFINHPFECVAAITDRLDVDGLIPPNIYETLLEINRESIIENNENLSSFIEEGEESNVSVQFVEPIEEVNSSEGEKGQINNKLIDNNVDNSDCYSNALKLKNEQNNCLSLTEVRKNLKLNKGNFILVESLIYHKDKILGETVTQLVLPLSRRDKVLKLAHESVFGGHLGIRKTKERIRYNFYWPNMSKDITEFVQTCTGCQLRKPDKITNRAPITPVHRPELPFQVVNIDIIGPIEPSSSRGHKYVLCLMDQHSRWPEAVPLRSLSAKSTCDALLQIFSRTGIPNTVASDQGTNFTSSLTKEFLRRIGSSPRFSCPGHPASNGLIERWNKVLKEMLHHVIREDPKSWDKQIPFLLFAYREVPNSTTGQSPFKLLYGREARGPLAILKSTWAGEINLPTNISQPAAEYLQEMKIRMEQAAEKASLVAAHKQKMYGDYFNKRSSVRNFSVGEQVILLIPDSNNKLYARWTGPCEIVQHHPPHTYKVKLPDGTIKHVHVNKIRKYYPRVQTIGVVFENDNEFGEIHGTPSSEVAPFLDHNSFDSIELDHLENSQIEEIKSILCKYPALFSGRVKIAKVGEHKIRLIPNSERKKPYVYRIPESLKHHVDDQIEELLRLGLIRESEAEIAHPVVCVYKKDGSIRLCIDFRSLNSVTQTDDFPMENATELMYDIGRSNIITTIDLLKGYWGIPMEEQSKELTSFKTHRSQYCFNVMPFGLKNAAATFQRVMNRALVEHKNFARAYIDDIAIFSQDWDSHLQHLNSVFSKLDDLGFTVNLKKCSFAKHQIKYLGHIIGSGKHQTDPDKIQAIKDLVRPQTKKNLRSLLGLCNYYREYIANYAEIARPLTELTKKSVPDTIPWTDIHEEAFLKLKRCLAEAPSLHTPIPGEPFVIQCDASSVGVGACLSQRKEGKLFPISYASQKLSKTQQAWPTIEREAYAIIWSLKKFETWIFGSTVDLITDHNPLTFITKNAPHSSKLQRWALALQRYDITVSHCPGAKLSNADALSRLETTDAPMK